MKKFLPKREDSTFEQGELLNQAGERIEWPQAAPAVPTARMPRISQGKYRNGLLHNGFDYTHRAWVYNGIYFSACDHDPIIKCQCYGRVHAGEPCQVPQPEPTTHKICGVGESAEEQAALNEMLFFAPKGV